MRAPWLTQGYLHDQAASNRLWEGGWLHTGDIGMLTPDGYLRITDRAKDVIKTGGEWVSSLDLEDMLRQMPQIAEAAVIGVPDPKYGEELMAWIKLRNGAAELTADDLRAFCSGRLAHYKIPRYVHIVDAFPMTVTGKIRKVEMREVSVQELGLQQAAAIKNA